MQSPITPFIKHYIDEHGFKQRAVAERAGYEPKKFSDMLHGRKIITAEDIFKISHNLGIEPNDLFSMADHRNTA